MHALAEAEHEPPETEAQPLLRTPLHALHVSLGARLVPFGGYEMPLQYPPGIMAEHLHTRTYAGLFDVSHMGQILLRPRSGRIEDAARALERLVPADIAALAPGRQRYTLFTSSAGGIADDLMVTNRGDHLLLVVNAARKWEDLALLRSGLETECEVEPLFERGLIALQGPRAAEALTELAPEAAAMRFMDVRPLTIAGVACVVSRSGYTGEDGFEIGMAGKDAVAVAAALLVRPGVAPVGLGARDSLRLEAGLCLHGSDIDAATTPVEAGLDWSIQKSRRDGGARAGGFPGAQIILAQIAAGAPRARVGIRPEGRQPLRAGAELFAALDGGEPVGTVTSGSFGPSVGAPVAMGYVDASHAGAGTPLFAEVRGRRLAAAVAPLPFAPNRYRR